MSQSGKTRSQAPARAAEIVLKRPYVPSLLVIRAGRIAWRRTA